MNFFKSRKFILTWLILGIPLLSYLLFKKTFNLALYGDDWLQLYNLWVSFDVQKTFSFFDIRSYLGAYWPQYFFLGIIRHISGYQAETYFTASLLLRTIATISIFFLIKKVSQSQLTGFLASLIFTFSVAGIQTTDWVFNMNTYAGIFFLNIALFFYFKLRLLKSFFSLYHLIFILFFALALGVAPVRMHGAVPLLFITELFIFIFFDKKNIQKLDPFLLIRLALPIVVMFILVKVGSFGNEGELIPQLVNSFSYVQDKFQENRYDILFYFLGITGNIVIPDTINLVNILSSPPVQLLFFTGLGLLISYAIGGGKRTFITTIIFNIFWAIISKMLLTWNPLLSINNLLSISVGAQFLLLSILSILNTKKTHPQLSIAMILGLFWIIFFSLLYWLRTPYLIIETTGRYMTMGAVGFSFIFAGFIYTLFKNLSKRSPVLLLPTAILIIWLSINYYEMNRYLTNLEINRNLTLASKIWDTLRKSVPDLDKNNPSVFYFTYDNSTAANMILVFGFSPHAGLSYGIPTWEKTPLPVEDYKQLLGMVTTGEPMEKIHSRERKPVPLDMVFAFNLKSGELIDITEPIRLKLSEDIASETK